MNFLHEIDAWLRLVLCANCIHSATAEKHRKRNIFCHTHVSVCRATKQHRIHRFYTATQCSQASNDFILTVFLRNKDVQRALQVRLIFGILDLSKAVYMTVLQIWMLQSEQRGRRPSSSFILYQQDKPGSVQGFFLFKGTFLDTIASWGSSSDCEPFQTWILL